MLVSPQHEVGGEPYPWAQRSEVTQLQAVSVERHGLAVEIDAGGQHHAIRVTKDSGMFEAFRKA